MNYHEKCGEVMGEYRSFVCATSVFLRPPSSNHQIQGLV
jgi:hypothetical protein